MHSQLGPASSTSSCTPNHQHCNRLQLFRPANKGCIRALHNCSTQTTIQSYVAAYFNNVLLLCIKMIRANPVHYSYIQTVFMLCRLLSWREGQLLRAPPHGAQPTLLGQTWMLRRRTCTSWTHVGTGTTWCMVGCTGLMLQRTTEQTPVGLQRGPCTMGVATYRGIHTSLPPPTPPSILPQDNP